MKLKKALRVMCSFPKTVYFNFRVFPFDVACKLPIFIDYETEIAGTKRGCVELHCEPKRFMIKFGIQDGTPGVPVTNEKQYLHIMDNGKLVFEGKAQFARGISLVVDKNGMVCFGSDFGCNKCCFIACSNQIIFGKNFTMGWNSCVRDMNGHDIWIRQISDSTKKEADAPIIFGDDVWIAAHVDVLKGAKIPDGCIVAYRSCVYKQFEEPRCIIGGNPAKIVQRDVYWK